MANEDRQSQQFIREVDEELRRAQLKAIWDRFSWLIIGACVLVVLLTAGYRGYLWWQERQAAEAGDRFMAAVEAIESGNRAEGEAELARMAEESGGGYPVLARFRLAAEKATAGAKAEALAAYDGIAADNAATEPMRALARVRAALLALDLGDLAGARDRAQPLNQPGNPWRHAAREVLGTAAYGSGDLQQARDYFIAIQQDAETPSDLWMRSGMMVSLIDGQVAAPGTPTVAPAEAPDAAAAPAQAPAAAAPATLPVPAGEAPVMAPAAPAESSAPTTSSSPAALPAPAVPPPPAAPAPAPTPPPAAAPPAPPAAVAPGAPEGLAPPVTGAPLPENNPPASPPQTVIPQQ